MNPVNLMPRTCIASVTNKQGLSEFLSAIPDLKIISTGGTKQTLEQAGLRVTAVESITGFPECFDGRVKTLHPAIFGGILHRRDIHAGQAAALGIAPIDLVVCNLYDFAGHLDVEHMDIGGSTLIRAAVKNHEHVIVVVDPNDYGWVVRELLSNNGLSLKSRQVLAAKALNLSADYEALLATELTRRFTGESTLRPKLVKGQELRYGENPSQKAWVYQTGGGQGIAQADLLAGKPLSYNNYEDATAAYRAARELHRLGYTYGAAVIKHGSLCGYAAGKTLPEAFRMAWDGDSKSAYGSVIALTSPVDSTLCHILKGSFIEVLIAPHFDKTFVDWAKDKRPDLRLLALPLTGNDPEQFRSVGGGMLVQTAQPDTQVDFEKIVTAHKPDRSWLPLYRFALSAVKFAKSNAIAIAHQPQTGCYQLLGVGAGQPNRVDSIERLALPKARENMLALYGKSDLSSCVLASDGFFPFADSISAAAAAGIKHCVQPGGSKRDDEVTAEANKQGMSMLLTGERYFSH